MSSPSVSILSTRVTSIGEAARLSNLTPRAIRLYEDKGLITASRDPAGARFFTTETVERLTFIALARRAGLTLRQIAGVMACQAEVDGSSAAARTIALCERRLQILDIEKECVKGVIATLAGEGPPL